MKLTDYELKNSHMKSNLLVNWNYHIGKVAWLQHHNLLIIFQ